MTLKSPLMPVDIVLAPDWWSHNTGMSFDEDFFYNPECRVQSERKMEQTLYDRWGRWGLGADRKKDLPIVGAVHLAAGFLVSEMLGCRVLYKADSPPQVVCTERPDLDTETFSPFESPAFKRFERLCEALQSKYGYLAGDVNWGGVLNVAMDLKGQQIFMDMCDKPDQVKSFLGYIAGVIERFTRYIGRRTGTTSISVNRLVRQFEQAVFLHSVCSHTMISCQDYKKFLLTYDLEWMLKHRPFGIHYCGRDPHRYAEVFAGMPALDFLDVGWGGDVELLRRFLPDTFLNIRLSPVEIIQQNPGEIEQTILQMVEASGNPHLTGVCCINMDHNVSDDKITAILETTEEIRKEIA